MQLNPTVSITYLRPIRRRRRNSRYRACAAFTRSPCSSSVARAASSAFAGQPRSRESRRGVAQGDPLQCAEGIAAASARAAAVISESIGIPSYL